MASLTLKDLPDELLARLRALAEVENRSLNKEVIHLLLDAVTRIGSPSRDALEREAQEQAAAWRDLQARLRVDLPSELADSRTAGRRVDL